MHVHRWLVIAAALVAGLTGCGLLGGVEGADACAEDSDCEIGERCEDGACTSEPEVRAARCGESDDCGLDILFVIDNSGSMMEEQEQLAQAIVPFVGELQSRGKRFHIGVITTDGNDCDTPFGSGMVRGSVPQRGCLQTSTLSPALGVVTWETPSPATALANIIRDVQVYGSAYEKGLAALRHFLTPGHDVPATDACDRVRDCSGDLADFLRTSAINAAGEEVEVHLLVVFLTDEEDCSHGGRIDETVSGNTELCYADASLLTPTEEFATFLRQLKPTPSLTSIALIAGLYDSGAGLRPSGCKGTPELSNSCDPSHGNSVAVCAVCVDENPVCPCHPEMTCPGGTHYPATNCCQADPATRYYNVATAMEAFGVASLCQSSYGAFLSGLIAGTR